MSTDNQKYANGLQAIGRYLAESCPELILPHIFGKLLGDLHLSYQPDSMRFHPEFMELYNRFVAHNHQNNCGDLGRLWSFILNIKRIIEEGVAGHFAELGVWRGNTAAVLAHFAILHARKAYFFDTYAGFDQRDFVGADANQPAKQFDQTSLDLVREVIGPRSEGCEFVRGYFPESIAPHHRTLEFAAVSLDCDLYEPMKAGLDFFYPRMPRGGLFLLHDYSSLCWPGSTRAVDEFCRATGENLILMPDKSGSAFIRKK
jgi:hypothetical protein